MWVIMNTRVPEIPEILEKMGFTKKEVEVYIYLAQSQRPIKYTDISNRLRIHKGDVYRIIKGLESKGVIESTLDRPMTFIAVPFEIVFDLYIKMMQEQLFYLKSERKEILAQAKFPVTKESPILEDKFLILKGRNMVFSKSYQMDREAKKDMIWMSTGLYELKYDQQIEKVRGIKIRAIMKYGYDDFKKVKSLLELTTKAGITSETRILDIGNDVTFTLQIADGKSALLILNPKAEDENLTAFWTNSKVFVHLWQLLFEKLWNSKIRS